MRRAHAGNRIIDMHCHAQIMAAKTLVDDVFQPEMEPLLKFASDRIVLGADYPFDMGEGDPVGLVNRVQGLSDADRAAICCGNAARLLKL